MGVFWRIISSNYHPHETLALEEKQGTISTDWPFFWRLGQYHYLLEVQDPRCAGGFFLYFHSPQDGTMRFHSVVHTPYVMVSVGPDRKQVWAETRDKELLPLIYTGIRKAGPLVSNKDGVSRSFLRQHVSPADITWT